MTTCFYMCIVETLTWVEKTPETPNVSGRNRNRRELHQKPRATSSMQIDIASASLSGCKEQRFFRAGTS
jgi:hypothetical protein